MRPVVDIAIEDHDTVENLVEHGVPGEVQAQEPMPPVINNHAIPRRAPRHVETLGGATGWRYPPGHQAARD